MPPALFRTIVAILVMIVAALALAPRKDSARSARPVAASEALSSEEAHRKAQQLGYYPPAPSAAVGMTPEWREFADAVDRICAVSFNRAQALAAQARRIGRSRGWNPAQMESTTVSIWSKQGPVILRATAKLGPPPKRPDLFERWRANVARRAALFTQASRAAAEGRFAQEGRIHKQIYRLKEQSDVIGQSFGLRICTSN